MVCFKSIRTKCFSLEQKKAIDPRYHNINKLIIQKKKYYLRHVDSDFFFKG